MTHDHLDDNELYGNKLKQYLCLEWQILQVTESMYFYECVIITTKAVVAMATILS